MGARRIFREGIRVFCLEASLGDYFVSPGQRCLWAAVRRISLTTFLVSMLRPESSAAQEVPERLYHWDSSVWSEQGDCGHRGRASSSGGVPHMRTVTETRFRRAPWGRKKHLLPLPILSVVLMVTAMASPAMLRMTVTVIDDTNLTLTASVQNVVHPFGPDGKIVGIMLVTNHASTDILLTAA